MPSGSPKTAASRRKPEAQSRVTTGKELLPGIDNRSAIARRYRDVMNAIVADQGGADRLAETRVQLIRRFSACACLAEQAEARMVNGEQIDIGEHALLISSMVRVGQRIGINRHAREIVPTLSQYLEARPEMEDDG